MKLETTTAPNAHSVMRHESKRLLSINLPGKRTALLASVMVLSGCAPLHSDLLDKNRSLLAPQSNSGMVLASLGYRNSGGGTDAYLGTTSLDVMVHSVAAPDAKPLRVSTTAYMRYNGAWGDAEVVRPSADGKRVLVGYSIPPGHYRLGETTARLFGFAEWRVSFQSNPAQQFTVEPGEVVYIGSHELDASSGNNWLGMPVPAKAMVRVLDEFVEDKALLYRVRPELESAPIRNAFADGGKAGAPMIASRPATTPLGTPSAEDMFERAVNSRAASRALTKQQNQGATQQVPPTLPIAPPATAAGAVKMGDLEKLLPAKSR